MKKYTFLFSLLCLIFFIHTINAEKFDPGPGKTIVMIGQQGQSEYQDYIDGVGITPAGSGFYYDLFFPKNKEYKGACYPHDYANVAICIKDNVVTAGYTGENAVWKACKDILTGKWDKNLLNLAESFKIQPRMRFFVQIGQHVNLALFANKTDEPFKTIVERYAQQGINALAQADQIPEFDLKTYTDVFAYIKRLFITNGATNCAFVYHPVGNFHDAKFLYPEDINTDWVGLSIFNSEVCLPIMNSYGEISQRCPSTQKMDTCLHAYFNWAADSIQKPVMIAQATVQEPAAGISNDFINYLDRVFHLIESVDIRCFTYINSNWTAQHWPFPFSDSRIQMDDKVKNHWINEITKSRYIHYNQTPLITSPSRSTTKTPHLSNPLSVSSHLHLSGVAHNTKSIIYSVNGTKLQQTKGNRIDISTLSSGVYFLHLPQSSTALRFIKQ